MLSCSTNARVLACRPAGLTTCGSIAGASRPRVKMAPAAFTGAGGPPHPASEAESVWVYLASMKDELATNTATLKHVQDDITKLSSKQDELGSKQDELRDEFRNEFRKLGSKQDELRDEFRDEFRKLGNKFDELGNKFDDLPWKIVQFVCTLMAGVVGFMILVWPVLRPLLRPLLSL